VHRNVATIVVHTDVNCLSVRQYAVDVLKVPHVIVGGHYGCAGIRATLDGTAHGLIDNWRQHVQDVKEAHLAGLNVMEQVRNIARTTIYPIAAPLFR